MDHSINIDAEEIAKFNALAQKWWDPKGPMKPLHQLNPLRLDYIAHEINLSEKKVLDVGCGGGILSESLCKKGALVTGLDLAESLLNIARKHAELSHLSIQYVESSIEDFSEKNKEAFDVVTCMELIEHVPDPMSVINACANVVKPNGLVFFSTLNRNLKSYCTAILGAEYVLNILPKGTHEYAQFIKPSELRKWASSAGLILKNLQGMSYHLIGDYFELSDDVSVNYMMCLQKNTQ